MIALIALASLVTADIDPRVEDIRVFGLRRVDSDVVTRVLKTKKGDPFDPARITEDIRLVFGTNLFKDIVVKKTVGAKNRHDVILLFEVKEKPSIKTVNFSGNDELSNDDVKGVIDVKVGQILNVDALAKNVVKIRELYINKGYYLSEVEYKYTESANNEVDVQFIIKENDKVEVKKITFLGNKHVDDEDLKAQMGTKEGSLISFITGTGTYREELFQADVYRLTNVYYDRGYINARPLKPQVQISGDRRSIYITIPIEEGEKYQFGGVSYSGDLELRTPSGEIMVDEAMLRSRVTVKQGEIFNRSQLFADIQRMADIYRDRGYAYANVTPNTKVNAETRTVDVQMEVERGDRVYFEAIEVSGNTKTRDKVIRRELRIYEGELFSASLVELSKQRVTALGYFETVEITTERGSAADRMKVKVEIKEKATGTFQVGAGFSSVERFIATAQVSQQNFLGRGQSFSLQAQLSFGPYGRQIFSFNFVEPYLFDTQFTGTLNLYWTQQLFRNFQRARRGGSIGTGYPLNDLGTLRLFLTYTGEYVEVGTASLYNQSQYTQQLFQLNQRGFVSSLRADLQYDSRDNRLFPTRGNFDLFSVEVADRVIGSQFNFLRFSGTARWYYPIVPGVVFRVNAQAGYIVSRDSQGPPISERYFMGGIFSMRGFTPLSVGPSLNVPQFTNDPTSANAAFTIGGNKQLQLNIELEFPVFEKAGFRGVVFLDAGNAYDETQNFFYIGSKPENIPQVYVLGSRRAIAPPAGLLYSTGFGIRWFSPIGPLRFEWGFPFTKVRPYDRDLVFEFTIGSFF